MPLPKQPLVTVKMLMEQAIKTARATIGITRMRTSIDNNRDIDNKLNGIPNHIAQYVTALKEKEKKIRIKKNISFPYTYCLQVVGGFYFLHRPLF